MQSVGVVAKISGKVFVKRNGKLILLKQGDEIFLGDEIVTQSSNDTIVINFDHAAPITLLEPQTIIITKELSNSIFDIIDSRNTRDASSSAASESVNAVLKVIGDSKDLVQLTHDFVKATKAEITTLNNKHSVVGDTYNKVDVTSDGDAVNQVYKATFNRQENYQWKTDKFNTHRFCRDPRRCTS